MNSTSFIKCSYTFLNANEISSFSTKPVSFKSTRDRSNYMHIDVLHINGLTEIKGWTFNHLIQQHTTHFDTFYIQSFIGNEMTQS